MTTPRSTPAGVTAAGRDRFGQSSSGRRPGSGFGAIGALAGVGLIALVVGGIVWAAATGKAPASQKPKIFGGSLVLDDYRPLTVIDLATGEVTVQLEGVYAQVETTNYGDVQAVATEDGTTLVNRRTGTFNMLGNDDYVLGPTNNGVSLGGLPGASGAAGFSDGSSTDILRYGPTSTVSLVDSSTAVAGAQALATRSAHTVRPLGFVHVTSRLANVPGRCHRQGLRPSVGAGQRRRKLPARSGDPYPSAPRGVECDPPLRPANGLFDGGARKLGRDRRAGDARARRTVRASWCGQVRARPGHRHRHRLHAGGGQRRRPLVPGQVTVRVVGGGRRPNGQVTSPLALRAFGPDAQPAVQAFSAGRIYTLDQAQPGQPTLWTINPATGAMGPVRGAAKYPAKSVTEKASFEGAEVLVNGPRVIFNNPQSLLAVVIFTDGSHAPVIVDKSNAVVVSAVGPRRCERQAVKDENHLTTGHQYADNYRNDCRASHNPARDPAGQLRGHHRETLRAPSELHLRVG